MVGVFCALDMVLFYLFFEGILIPMYLIIGIWGGPRRIYAAFKFFLYTLLGSVLFLIAILVMYLQAGTTDIPTLISTAISTPACRLALARDVRLVRGQGADVAVPHLAAGRPRRGADRGLGGAGGRPAEARRLRLPALLAADAARRLGLFHAARLRALDRRDHLHLAGRPDAERHEEADRLLLGRPHGHRHDRHLHAQRARHAGRASSRCSATASSRPRSSCASAWSTTASTPARSRAMAASPSGCRSTPPCSCCSCWPRSACPGTSGFVGEILVIIGVFQVDSWVGAPRRDRHDPRRRLHALALPPGRSSAR